MPVAVTAGALRRVTARRGAPTRDSRVVPLAVLVVLAGVVFSSAGNGFLSPFNLNSLSQVVAQGAVLGFAQAALMVMGRINLAVGGIGVVVVATIGILATNTGIPLPAILLIGIAVGAFSGAVMAAVEILTGLNSFVVTLAFLSIYQGGVLLATQAVHYPVFDPSLSAIGNGNLLIPAVSPLLGVAIVLAIALWFFYFRTASGWRSRAVGANQRAAAASGIDVRRSIVGGYALSGALSAIAGIMEISRLAEASPSTGSDWLLLSFIGPLLAGVALAGGTISIAGIVLGALFYASIFSGLVILAVPTYWLTLAQALVLLLALVVAQAGGAIAARLRSLTRGGRRSSDA